MIWGGWGADWPSIATVIPPLFDSRINLTKTSNGQDYGNYQQRRGQRDDRRGLGRGRHRQGQRNVGRDRRHARRGRCLHPAGHHEVLLPARLEGRRATSTPCPPTVTPTSASSPSRKGPDHQHHVNQPTDINASQDAVAPGPCGPTRRWGRTRTCGPNGSRPTRSEVPVFAYTVRRCISGVILLVVMSLVTFVLFFASPIDPERFACGKNCSPAQLEQTRRRSATTSRSTCSGASSPRASSPGASSPTTRRCARRRPSRSSTARPAAWATPTATRQTVNSLIKDKMPVSVSLAIAAFFIWITAGVLFGVIAALFKGHDHRPRPSSACPSCLTPSRRSSSACCC